MSIFKTLHWNQIFQPLPGDGGCGSDLQYDAVYDAIRRARQPDADSLPSGMWERPGKKIDWEFIGRQCFEFLTQRSKDLQVGAWMVEAFVYSQDLEGAARGMALFSEMTITFWNDIHPQIEDGDVELRLRPVNWLLRESLNWFSRELPVTPVGQTVTGLNYECRHAHWQTLSSKFLLLGTFLSEKLPDDSPNFREIHECLNAQLVESVPPQQQLSDAEIVNSKFYKITTTTRDTAYDQLREIADFLARIEPHSPVPMVLHALTTWRDIGFEDLLERLPAQGGASIYELMRLFKTGSSQ